MRSVAIVLLLCVACVACAEPREAPALPRLSFTVRASSDSTVQPIGVDPLTFTDADVVADDERTLGGGECAEASLLDVELQRTDGVRLSIVVAELDAAGVCVGERLTLTPGTRVRGSADRVSSPARIELADDEGPLLLAQQRAALDDDAVRPTFERSVDGPFRSVCSTFDTTAIRVGDQVIESGEAAQVDVNGRAMSFRNVRSVRFTIDASKCPELDSGDVVDWIAVPAQ
jgi:hypothetical protein